MHISGYTSYANSEAKELAEWGLELFEKGKRTKASKIKKIADKMEDKYRNSKEFKNKKRKNEYNRRNRVGCVEILYEPLFPPIKKEENKNDG